MTSDCALHLPFSALENSSSAQVQHYNVALCGILHMNGLVFSLQDSSFRGFSAKCFFAWNPVACSVLHGENFQFMGVTLIENMSSSCVANLPKDFLVAMDSPARIAVLSQSVCQRMDNLGAIRAIIDLELFGHFSGDCVKAWTNNTCKYLNAEDFGKLDEHVFRAMTKSCFESLNVSVFKSFSAPQISHLSNELCGLLTADMFKAIHPLAYSGFQSKCIAQFNINACGGLQGAGLNNFNLHNVPAIRPACMAQVLPKELSNVTDIGKELPSDICEVFTPEQVAALSPKLVSSVSCDCVKRFVNCNGFQADQFVGFDYAGCLSTDCWIGLPSDALVNISIDAVGSLPSNICRVISPAQLQSMESVGGAFMPYCAHSWRKETCKGLSSLFLDAMLPASLNTITDECFANIPPSSFIGALPEVVKGFSGRVCSLLNHHQINSISLNGVKGFEPTCTQMFQPPLCSRLSTKIIGGFSNSAISGIVVECLKAFSKDQWQALSIEQVASIAPHAFKAVCHTPTYPIVDLLFKFGEELPKHILKIQSEGLVSEELCWQQINAEFVNGIFVGKGEFSSQMTNLQVAFTSDDAFAKLSLSAIASLGEYQIAGIRESHSRLMSDEQLLAFPHRYLWSCRPDFFRGLVGSHIHCFVNDEFESFAAVFGFLPLSAIDNLLQTQLQVISTEFDVCIDQAKRFTDHQVSLMQPEMQDHIKTMRKSSDVAYPCPKRFPPIYPKSSPSSSSGSSSSSSGGSSSSSSLSSGSSSNKNRSSRTIIMRITALVLVLLLLIIGITIFISRSQGSSDQHLKSLDFYKKLDDEPIKRNIERKKLKHVGTMNSNSSKSRNNSNTSSLNPKSRNNSRHSSNNSLNRGSLRHRSSHDSSNSRKSLKQSQQQQSSQVQVTSHYQPQQKSPQIHYRHVVHQQQQQQQQPQQQQQYQPQPHMNIRSPSPIHTRASTNAAGTMGSTMGVDTSMNINNAVVPVVAAVGHHNNLRHHHPYHTTIRAHPRGYNIQSLQQNTGAVPTPAMNGIPTQMSIIPNNAHPRSALGNPHAIAMKKKPQPQQPVRPTGVSREASNSSISSANSTNSLAVIIRAIKANSRALKRSNKK
eukprot:TRINITY_DN588_c1_g1_i1.p1 TRINITY_DN588_c1_g1~~TRINITY_DN588_c1_g1_i1.p1  ORF type:complete len:1155 (+),score=273.03 TRINITY_DN588_c1_g1_i1:174-3467(+)